MTTALEGGEGSASRPGRSLPPGKTWYLLYRRLGGPQSRSGQVRKISPPHGNRTPDRPALSLSLYRLRYLAHNVTYGVRTTPANFDMYMSYRPLISYDLGHRTAHAPHKFVTSHRGHWPYWYVYHVSLDEFRCFSKRYHSYALRKHMCGIAGCGGYGK
jgi:hypothetical protein